MLYEDENKDNSSIINNQTNCQPNVLNKIKKKLSIKLIKPLDKHSIVRDEMSPHNQIEESVNSTDMKIDTICIENQENNIESEIPQISDTTSQNNKDVEQPTNRIQSTLFYHTFKIEKTAVNLNYSNNSNIKLGLVTHKSNYSTNSKISQNNTELSYLDKHKFKVIKSDKPIKPETHESSIIQKQNFKSSLASPFKVSKEIKEEGVISKISSQSKSNASNQNLNYINQSQKLTEKKFDHFNNFPYSLEPVSEQDLKIITKDIPERIQTKTINPLYDDKIKKQLQKDYTSESQWIADKLSVIMDKTPDSLNKQIEEILVLHYERKFDIPFIVYDHCLIKRNDLKDDDIWNIFKFDLEWRSLANDKNIVLNLYNRLIMFSNDSSIIHSGRFANQILNAKDIYELKDIEKYIEHLIEIDHTNFNINEYNKMKHKDKQYTLPPNKPMTPLQKILKFTPKIAELFNYFMISALFIII